MEKVSTGNSNRCVLQRHKGKGNEVKGEFFGFFRDRDTLGHDEGNRQQSRKPLLGEEAFFLSNRREGRDS